MTRMEVEMFLMRMAQERMLLHATLEANEGEVTQEVLSQEEIVQNLTEIFKSEGGIDAVGRFVKSGQDKIAARKAEKEYAERHLKAEENEQERFLSLINIALETDGLDKVKGDFGYSFTAHTSTTTKPDNKLIKELFYDKVEKVIRESGVVPEDITFTLSASATRLSEDLVKPEWYNTTSVGKATFRKPRKADDTEFTMTDF